MREVAGVRLSVIAVALLAAVACSSSPTAPHADLISAADAYSPRAGEVWAFVNGYGDTTTITTEIPGGPIACRGGRNVVWHYRKTAARAYWLPGVDGAEIRFVLHQNPDSSWRSTASVIALPHSCPWCNGATQITWNILDNQPGAPLGYQIVPPTLRRGDTVSTGESHADASGGPGLLTMDCVVPDGQLVTPSGHGSQWRTDFYLEDVATPAYSGPASVSEQWENCNETRTNAGCGHEKWWFAPGLGLVKVRQLNGGSGIEDPKITMVRVR